MGEQVHFFDLTLDDVRAWAVDQGWPAYQGNQLLDWVYTRGVIDPAQMTDLSRANREVIAESFKFLSGREVDHQIASDGVQKLLVQWEDDASALAVNDPRRQTECVMIPSDDNPKRARRTACISSQVGCAVGCTFCASGLGGLDGNLSAGRIVEQVWRLKVLKGVKKITNVVFMGMGEPLANFEAVTRAIGIIHAKWGLGVSGRRITVSTVGLPAQIRRLVNFKVPLTLAISLHAPNDELRRQLIPWAENVSIEQLIEAGIYFFEKTRREITLEYILLGGVNDQVFHARELAVITKRLRANVNLICYNEVEGLPFERPGDGDVHRFHYTLRRAGVNAHIRASRGRDIAAACGQLRYEGKGQSGG